MPVLHDIHAPPTAGGIECWLYVSRCILPPTWSQRAVASIMGRSAERNAALGITGALLFTGSRFVQFLEGPPSGIKALQRIILHDTRHCDVRTALAGPRAERLFEGCSLAYAGPSMFVGRMVDSLVRGQRDDAEAMITLLFEFAAMGQRAR